MNNITNILNTFYNQSASIFQGQPGVGSDDTTKTMVGVVAIATLTGLVGLAILKGCQYFNRSETSAQKDLSKWGKEVPVSKEEKKEGPTESKKEIEEKQKFVVQVQEQDKRVETLLKSIENLEEKTILTQAQDQNKRIASLLNTFGTLEVTQRPQDVLRVWSKLACKMIAEEHHEEVEKAFANRMNATKKTSGEAVFKEFSEWFDENFVELNKITYLNLSDEEGGNEIVCLPDQLSRLENLKILSLRNNSLSSFNVISKIKNLENLYLENNKIEVIPDEISQLKKLKNLYLSGNQISKISPKIEELNLGVIDMRGNGLLTIEVFPSKMNVKVMRLGQTPIQRQPENEPKLREIAGPDVQIIN